MMKYIIYNIKNKIKLLVYINLYYIHYNCKQNLIKVANILKEIFENLLLLLN